MSRRRLQRSSGLATVPDVARPPGDESTVRIDLDAVGIPGEAGLPDLPSGPARRSSARAFAVPDSPPDDPDLSTDRTRERPGSADIRARSPEARQARTRTPAPDPGDSMALTRGAAVGRYLIVNTLGSGGMGVVYEAYDPDLHRQVAIKVLALRSSHKTRSRARLLREAQALAQVSHPNVVSVYDIGLHHGSLFIAMELVQGVPLREWLAGERPPPERILDVFADVCRGLAAIHAAGLIHRDLKPSNIMVGDDGRVRVLDLGVARAVATFDAGDGVPDVVADELSGRGDRSSDRLLARPLTRVGAVIGTVNYMAPEQHVGVDIDARADQFALCVTLWEALYGYRPFGGRTPDEVKRSVLTGAVVAPPSGSGVSAHVHRAMCRGLSLDPADRFPSIDDLLSEIRTHPPGLARRVLPLAGIALLAGVVALALALARSGVRSDLCAGGRARALTAWSPDDQRALAAAFDVAGKPAARDAYQRVTAAFDDYSERWLAQRRAVCEATRVHREQSEAVMDLRMQCLDRRLDRLRALVGLFSRPLDPEALPKAAEAARTLPGPAGCAGDEALAQVVPLPDEPAARERIAAVEARLDEVHALAMSGMFKQALAPAVEVADAAAEVGYAPLEAQALRRLATIQSELSPADAEPTFHRAAEAAARARDDDLLADSYVLLVWMLGDRLGRHDDALALYPLANAAVTRAGDDERRVELMRARASIAGHKGDYDQARAELERAYELWTRIPDPERDIEHLFQNSLGVIAFWQGHPDVALDRFRRAAEIIEERFGPDHYMLADCYHNMATIQQSLGRYEEALALAQRNLDLERQTYGPDHPTVGNTLQLLATIYADKGDYEAAERSVVDALRIMEAAYGPDHARLANPIINAGYVYSLQREHRMARPYYERAVELVSAQLGPEHPQLAAPLYNLGSTLQALGRCDQATPLFLRAVAIMDKIDRHHAELVSPLVGLGECALAGDGARAALPHLERALAIAAARELDPHEVARTKFALARAMSADRKRRRAARELAGEARALLAGLDRADSRDVLAQVDRWLRNSRK